MSVAAVVGLVGGWLLRRGAAALDRLPPYVTWTQPLALLLVAAVLCATAWLTSRAMRHGHTRPEPHRMVNRLVLARASMIAGALVAGGYAGYALSWLGSASELAELRGWRSLAAAGAGVAVLVSGLWLERACRVPSEDDAP